MLLLDLVRSVLKFRKWEKIAFFIFTGWTYYLQWYYLDRFVFDATGQGILKYYVQIQLDPVLSHLMFSSSCCENLPEVIKTERGSEFRIVLQWWRDVLQFFKL